jgi:hypothetical protein
VAQNSRAALAFHSIASAQPIDHVLTSGQHVPQRRSGIFMYLSPRGSALHSTVNETTAALNKARALLDREVAAV